MDRFKLFFKLLNDNQLIDIFMTFIILSVVLIGLIVLIICISIRKDKIQKFLRNLLPIAKRFALNFFKVLPITVFLVILYFIFNLFDFGDDMLPELLGVGISLYFINFVLAEKEYSERKNVDIILNNKMKNIKYLSKKMLLDYIGFENFNTDLITKDLLVNTLGSKDLLTDTIQIPFTDENGKPIIKEILLIDYPYYIGSELRTVVDQVICFSAYIDLSKLEALIKLQEVLNKRLFTVKISSMDGITTETCKRFFDPLINALVEINNILSHIE